MLKRPHLQLDAMCLDKTFSELKTEPNGGPITLARLVCKLCEIHKYKEGKAMTMRSVVAGLPFRRPTVQLQNTTPEVERLLRNLQRTVRGNIVRFIQRCAPPPQS